MPKYKEYVVKMMEADPELFKKFRVVHDKFVLDEDKHQTEFNEVGVPVMKLVREWESRLCKGSEGGGFNKFTGKLAEKFQGEVRKEFSMIDWVGVETNPTPKKEKEDDFNLKKISVG